MTSPIFAAETSTSEAISPELALVDPELRRRAVAALPEPDAAERGRADALAAHRNARLAAQRSARLPPAEAEADASAVRTKRRRIRRRVLASLLVLAAVAATIAAAWPAALDDGRIAQPATGEPPPMPAPKLVPTRRVVGPVTPSAQVKSRRARRQKAARDAHKPAPAPAARTFVWPPRDGADYYVVRFVRGGRTVFEARTVRSRLVVPAAGSSHGRGFRFAPGRYRWVVRPGYGSRARRRYGRPIIVSTWTVQPPRREDRR